MTSQYSVLGHDAASLSNGLPTFRRSIMFRCQGCRCPRTILILVWIFYSPFLSISDVSFEPRVTDYSATFLIHTSATPLNSRVIIFFRDQRAPQLSMSLPCKTGHNGGVGMLLSSGVDVSARRQRLLAHLTAWRVFCVNYRPVTTSTSKG